MIHIYHITKKTQWEAALKQGSYESDTLATEGFTHCSKVAQLLRVANSFYQNQDGLVILCIEEAAVNSDVRHEAPIHNEQDVPEGELFPHIYGKLNLDAVFDVINFPPHADGLFSLPSKIRWKGEIITNRMKGRSMWR